MIHDDHDWYFENIVVAGRPALLGPVAKARLRWQHRAESLDADDPAIALALQQGFVLTHDQARAVGRTTVDIRRNLRRGRWTAPRYGVLCVLPSDVAADEYSGRLRIELRAAAGVLARPATTASHDSSAAMHGLPLWHTPSRPRVTDGGNAGEGWHDIVVHAAALGRSEITDWYGTAVTTVARTVVDVARNFGARSGLVVADAALRENLVTRAGLEAAVRRQTRWPGVRTARRVVELADGRAESPLESVVRLFLHDQHLPIPDLQRWVETANGRYRVDGLWRARRVVLEVDGMTKYDQPAYGAKDRRREFALERAGYRVVRVTWEDVRDRPRETVARIWHALRLGGFTLGAGSQEIGA